MISGTHGTVDGVSGLTDIDRTDLKEGYGFYFEDCRKAGIEAGPFRSKQREPLLSRKPFTDLDWEDLPDITKPAEKANPPPPKSLQEDERTKKMDIRVAYTTYYYKNEKKLIRDIKKVHFI